MTVMDYVDSVIKRYVYSQKIHLCSKDIRGKRLLVCSENIRGTYKNISGVLLHVIAWVFVC